MSKSSEGKGEPRFRLIYYNFRGRAELIRLIFEHLEIPYIDQRISIEEWTKRKPGAVLRSTYLLYFAELSICSFTIHYFSSCVRADSPFGVIPMLDFDGKIISGSTGIARWIAEDCGKDVIKHSCSQYRMLYMDSRVCV